MKFNKIIGLCVCLLICACVPAVFTTGTLTSVYLINSKETPKELISDKLLLKKVKSRMWHSEYPYLALTTDAYVVKSRVYLFGNVKTDDEKEKLEQSIKDISGIKSITNDITVGKKSYLIGIIRDGLVTFQTRTLMILSPRVHSPAFYVKTFYGVSHLVPTNLDDPEIELVSNLASKVAGVKSVIIYNE